MDNNTQGVGAYAFDIRTEKDKQMLADYSCNKVEGYQPGITQQNIFIEPRTVKDQMMLAAFNPCVCRGGDNLPTFNQRVEQYRQ